VGPTLSRSSYFGTFRGGFNFVVQFIMPKKQNSYFFREKKNTIL